MKNIFKIILVLAVGVVPAESCFAWNDNPYVDNCPHLEVMFARGSGAEPYNSEVYSAVHDGLEQEYKNFGMTYRLSEVDYPAVPIANLQQIFEAYISAGRAYEFGASVEAGVQDVLDYRDYIRWKCPDSKFVLIGYSQGAMVVKDAAKSFDAEEFGYLLAIGDPETYLPEGEGWFPRACTSSPIDYSLSRWRLYAPECHTFEGLFGGAKPYEPEQFRNKYALVCNENDYICGSSHNPFRNGGHTEYASSGIVSWAVNELCDAKLRRFWMELEGLTERPIASWSVARLANAEKPSVLFEMRRIGNDRLLLSWDAPPGADYVFISLNGVVLGYIDAARGELEMREVDFDRENLVGLSFVSQDGEMITNEAREPPTEIEPVIEEIVPKPVEPDDALVRAPGEVEQMVSEPESLANDSVMNDENVEAQGEDVVVTPIEPTRNMTIPNEAAKDGKPAIKITVAVIGASVVLFLFWFGKRG